MGHCCYLGGLGQSIWYVVDLEDISMKGLGVYQPIARLGVAWHGVRECYLAILPSDDVITVASDKEVIMNEIFSVSCVS